MAAKQGIRMEDLGLFADCSKAELSQIASLVTYLEVPEGRVLMREGGLAREFIVICGGTAHVSCQTAEGVATVADVGSGDFLGEMGLLSGNRRSATATAATDLEFFVSSASEFRSILAIAPSVAAKVVQASIARSASKETSKEMAA